MPNFGNSNSIHEGQANLENFASAVCATVAVPTLVAATGPVSGGASSLLAGIAAGSAAILGSLSVRLFFSCARACSENNNGISERQRILAAPVSTPTPY